MNDKSKKYELGILSAEVAEELRPVEYAVSGPENKNILVLGGSETFSKHRQKRYCEIVEDLAFPDLHLNMGIIETQTEGYVNPHFFLFYINDEEEFKYTKKQYKQMEFAHRRDEYYRGRCNIIGMRYLSEDGAEYYANELLNDIFLPQIAEKNGKRWQRLDTEIAARNMRKWIIFGHCFGDRIARYMDFLMSHKMLKIGYSPEDTAYIKRQTVVFGHNSMVASLGRENDGFLYFERMLAKDGEYQSRKFPQDSFQSYFQRMKISDDKVYLVSLNEREVTLLLTTTNDMSNISSVVINEHDKGYWKNAECKTLTAQKEERVFRTIFNEVLRTDYLLHDWRHIIDNSLKNSQNNRDEICQAIKNGQHYYPMENRKNMPGGLVCKAVGNVR